VVVVVVKTRLELERAERGREGHGMSITTPLLACNTRKRKKEEEEKEEEKRELRWEGMSRGRLHLGGEEKAVSALPLFANAITTTTTSTTAAAAAAGPTSIEMKNMKMRHSFLSSPV